MVLSVAFFISPLVKGLKMPMSRQSAAGLTPPRTASKWHLLFLRRRHGWNSRRRDIGNRFPRAVSLLAERGYVVAVISDRLMCRRIGNRQLIRACRVAELAGFGNVDFR